MSHSTGSYLSFLLRLRRVDNGGRPLWHLSLEAPGAARAHHFASVADLLDFLRSEMQLAESADAEANRGTD